MPSSKLLLCLISLMREMRHNKRILERRRNFFLPCLVRDVQDKAKRSLAATTIVLCMVRWHSLLWCSTWWNTMQRMSSSNDGLLPSSTLFVALRTKEQQTKPTTQKCCGSTMTFFAWCSTKWNTTTKNVIFRRLPGWQRRRCNFASSPSLCTTTTVFFWAAP